MSLSGDRPPARRIVLGLVLVAIAVTGTLVSCPDRAARTPLDDAITFHEEKLRDDPGLYAVRAELGEALLERARVTHDPDDVRRARAELERSIATQDNFQAFKTMTALCNFSHRFQEALTWAERARDAYPEDTGVTAQQVEALLGLGRVEEADATVRRRTAKEPDFFLIAAEARTRSAEGDVDGAVAAFGRAAEIAKRFGAPALGVWSNVSAAAALLDNHRAAEAEPYLNAAAAIDPRAPLLRVHRAEFLAARGQVREAIDVYESLLQQFADPVLHAGAFSLRQRLGDTREARRHFRAAEAGFRRAIDAGEIYTLESLARLYLDADTKLAEARALAERNLQFKQDGHARLVLQNVETRMNQQR